MGQDRHRELYRRVNWGVAVVYQVTELTHEVYQRILPGLECIVLRCPDITWTPAVLWQELEQGQTRLFVDDDHPGNFLIVRLDYNALRQEVEMFVRAAYADSGQAMDYYADKLVKLAQYFYAARITMQSSRPGFIRRAEWNPLSVLYAQEVSSE